MAASDVTASRLMDLVSDLTTRRAAVADKVIADVAGLVPVALPPEAVWSGLTAVISGVFKDDEANVGVLVAAMELIRAFVEGGSRAMDADSDMPAEVANTIFAKVMEWGLAHADAAVRAAAFRVLVTAERRHANLISRLRPAIMTLVVAELRREDVSPAGQRAARHAAAYVLAHDEYAIRSQRRWMFNPTLLLELGKKHDTYSAAELVEVVKDDPAARMRHTENPPPSFNTAVHTTTMDMVKEMEPYMADLFAPLVALAIKTRGKDYENVGETTMVAMYHGGALSEYGIEVASTYMVMLDTLSTLAEIRPDVMCQLVLASPVLSLVSDDPAVVDVTALVYSCAIRHASVTVEPGRVVAERLLECFKATLLANGVDAGDDMGEEEAALLGTKLWACEYLFDQLAALNSESEIAVMDSLYRDVAVAQTLHRKLVALIMYLPGQRAPNTGYEAMRKEVVAGVLSHGHVKLRSFALSAYARFALCAIVYAGGLRLLASRPGVSESEKATLLEHISGLKKLVAGDMETLLPPLLAMASNVNPAESIPLNMRLEDHACEAMCALLLPLPSLSEAERGRGVALLAWAAQQATAAAGCLAATPPTPRRCLTVDGHSVPVMPTSPDYNGLVPRDAADKAAYHRRSALIRRVHAMFGMSLGVFNALSSWMQAQIEDRLEAEGKDGDMEALEAAREAVTRPMREAFAEWMLAAAKPVEVLMAAVVDDGEVELLEEVPKNVAQAWITCLAPFLEPASEVARAAACAAARSMWPLLTPTITWGGYVQHVVDLSATLVDMGWFSSEDTMMLGVAVTDALAADVSPKSPASLLCPPTTEGLLKGLFAVIAKEPRMWVLHGERIVEALLTTHTLMAFYYGMSLPEEMNPSRLVTVPSLSNMMEIVLGVCTILSTLRIAVETFTDAASMRSIQGTVREYLKPLTALVCKMVFTGLSYVDWFSQRIVAPAADHPPPEPTPDVKRFMDSSETGVIMNGACRMASAANAILHVLGLAVGKSTVLDSLTPPMMSLLSNLGMEQRVVGNMILLVARHHVEPWAVPPESPSTGNVYVDCVAATARGMMKADTFAHNESEANDFLSALLAEDEAAGGDAPSGAAASGGDSQSNGPPPDNQPE